VEDGFTTGDQIISDNAPVASPPDRFRTHQRTATLAPQREEMLEPNLKLLRKRIVGVVMKALVRPESVDVVRQGSRLSAQAAECGHMFVRNVVGRQRVGQRLLVELRVRSRSRNLSDIRNDSNIGCSQQLGKFLVASVGMADGEERRLQVLLLPRTRSSALPL